MVYLYYISCLRYTILVGNRRIMKDSLNIRRVRHRHGQPNELFEYILPSFLLQLVLNMGDRPKPELDLSTHNDLLRL